MESKNEPRDYRSYLSSSSKSLSQSEEKIDVEELIKDFKIFNIESFDAYLTSLWEVDIILLNF